MRLSRSELIAKLKRAELSNVKLEKMLSHFEEIVLRRDIEYSELQAGLGLLIWACWTSAFEHNHSVVPGDYVIDVLGIIVGLAQVLALIVNHIPSRRVLAIVACMVWFGLCMGFIFEDRALAAIQSALFSFGAGWAYIRIGRAVREAEQ